MFKNPFASSIAEEEFWTWFSGRNQQFLLGVFSEEERQELYDELNSYLKACHDELSFLFSTLSPEGKRTLTFSSDGDLDVFPKVHKLIEMAPEIENWQFIAFRQPLLDANFCTSIGDKLLSYSDVYYRYAGDERVLGLQLMVRDYDGSPEFQNAVYVLLDSLLGEYDTAKEITYLDWQILDEEDLDQLFPLKNLVELIGERKAARL